MTEERRADEHPLLPLITQLINDVRTMRAELSTHMIEESAEIAEKIAAEIVRLQKEAFPDGDPSGHKRAHEAQIAVFENRAAFWKKMQFEIAKWGLAGFLGWAAYALWQAFLQGPHKP